MSGQKWVQPLTVAAQGLNPDIGGTSGLAPGLYKVQILDGEVEPGKEGKAPNIVLEHQVLQALGEGASPPGTKDKSWVSTGQEEIHKRGQKAVARSVGYSKEECEQPTFQLLPQRVINQAAWVFAQRNGVNDRGYPNIDRNFVTPERAAKLAQEIQAAGGKVPLGIRGMDGRKDGGTGAATALPGLPPGGAPNFGAGAPGTAGFPTAAPAPVFGAQPGAGAPAPFAAPAAQPVFGQPAPVAAPPAFGQPNGAPAGFAQPDLSAMGGQTQVKM